MDWKLKISKKAKKSLDKLDHVLRDRIAKFIFHRIGKTKDPRLLGAPLTGSALGLFWKYRVGDYRIIAQIDDNEVKILILKIGHRSKVYKKN